MRRLAVLGLALPVALGACALNRGVSELVPAWSLAAGPAPSAGNIEASSVASAADEYLPIPDDDAAVLGCANADASPICAVATPNAEEDSAFRAEGVRLANHPDSRCRRLGQAISETEPTVRMYRKALVRWSGATRMYGVGHAYEIDDVWVVRVARMLDDLNDRSLEEKKRTLRHEVSHTIGATETPGSGWTAEDYASGCTSSTTEVQKD